MPKIKMEVWYDVKVEEAVSLSKRLNQAIEKETEKHTFDKDGYMIEDWKVTIIN